MTTRVKRTFNLTERTIRRVRELADEYGSFRTQDGVVEAAIEQLYVTVRAEAEAARWQAATEDPEFQVEMATVAQTFDDRDTWPA